VLSIQSHVVSGYVGNKAAVFPLQLLGWNVDVVNTVQFSNHSGYGVFGGTKTSAEELKVLFEHMERNGLLYPDRILTGYIPNASSLKEIMGLVSKLKERNRKLIYLLDPVMGDEGQLYVSPDVVPLYKELLSSATIITPNYFEVERLTGVELNSHRALQRALRILHVDYGVPHVVISSVPVCKVLRREIPEEMMKKKQGELLLCLCSEKEIVSGIIVEKLEGYFSGVGDLFSALVLGHYDDRWPLSRAMSRAVWTVQGILKRGEVDDNEDLVVRMRKRELKLIESADLILNPVVVDSSNTWRSFWE